MAVLALTADVRVRVGDPAVETAEQLFGRLSQGGTVVEDPTYAGTRVVFRDGTTVGLRQSGSGPTVDVNAPNSGLPSDFRIHFLKPFAPPPIPCDCGI